MDEESLCCTPATNNVYQLYLHNTYLNKLYLHGILRQV